MREMGGIKQWPSTDTLVRPVLRIVFAVMHASPARVRLANLRLISPASVPVVAPVLLGKPPVVRVVVTPAQARERYGYSRPRDAHLEFRAKQHDRVFGRHEAPSDDGLRESEPVLGRLA